MKSEIITIRELAHYLKMTEKTLYRLAADGAIPGFKVGGAWRFRCGRIEIRKRESERKDKKYNA